MSSSLKSTVISIKTKVLDALRKHPNLYSYLVVALIVIVGTVLSLASLSKTLDGHNLDYYYSFKATFVSFISFIKHPNILGHLFLGLLTSFAKINGSIYYLVSVLLYACLSITSLFVIKRLSNNHLYGVVGSLLISFSFIGFTSLLFIESIPSIFSTILFLWAYYFLKEIISINKTQVLIIGGIVILLYYLSSTLPLLFLPLIVLLFVKSEKNIKNYVIFGTITIVSIVFSITTLKSYNSFKSEYFGYVLEGIVNTFSLPFGYHGPYVAFSLKTSLITRAVMAINSLLLLSLVGFAVITFVFTQLSRLRDDKKIVIINLGLTFLEILLFVLLMGYLRSYSIFSLLAPYCLLIVLLSIYMNKEKQAYKISACTIVSVTSLVAVIFTFLSFKDLNPSYDNYFTDNIAFLEKETGEGDVTLVCNNVDYQKWEQLLDQNNTINKSKVKLVNYEKWGNISYEDYCSGKTYAGFNSIHGVNDGIYIEQSWIMGTSFNTTIYTQDSGIHMQLYIPEAYPKNDTNIIINGEIVYRLESWKGMEYFDYELPTKGGTYLDITISSQNSVRAYDYIPGSPDKTPLSVFIAKLNTF